MFFGLALVTIGTVSALATTHLLLAAPWGWLVRLGVSGGLALVAVGALLNGLPAIAPAFVVYVSAAPGELQWLFLCH